MCVCARVQSVQCMYAYKLFDYVCACILYCVIVCMCVQCACMSMLVCVHMTAGLLGLSSLSTLMSSFQFNKTGCIYILFLFLKQQITFLKSYIRNLEVIFFSFWEYVDFNVTFLIWFIPTELLSPKTNNT